MANKNLLKSKAVLKAISIGLAAMMAMTPVVGATDVYADDVDGNEGEQVAETKPQESVNLSGSAETSSSNEDSSDSSSSESITGKADVTTDANGDITVEATVEGESVDIDETKQSDSNVVVNADGSITETDTALSLGTDKSKEGDTTTNTETEVNTTIETTTAADIKDYDNVSSEKTEGSTVVQTTVTSVSVAVTTTETTITTSYDEQVTDPEVIAIIEAAIANPQEGQIREDETGKYIKIGDAEYKYTQTTNTVPVDITSKEVLENINKELLKEDKETHTDDNGNNYIKVGDTWYEYKTETVDSSSESGQETMDKLNSEAENVTAEKTVTNNDNSVTETKVLTVEGKSYTYKVTTAVIEVKDEELLEQIKYDVEHENGNVEVKDGNTYVTIEGVTYTYLSEAGTDVVTVDEKSDKELLDKIKVAAESVEVNEDGTKTVTVGGVEYKYTAETSEDIILDATKDKATIDKIKAALEEAEKNEEQIATKTIDDVEYKIIVIDGVTYGFNSFTSEPTKSDEIPVTEEDVMASLRDAYKKSSDNVKDNGDGTYTITLESGVYVYTPASDTAVSSNVAKLIELSKYNAISTNDMWVNGHINGGIIVCQSLHGNQFVDNNLSSGGVTDANSEKYVESKIEKVAGDCNVSMRVINDNKGNGGQVSVSAHVTNNNKTDSTYSFALTDLSQESSKEIKDEIEDLWDSVVNKFTDDIKEYVKNGITFKLVDKASELLTTDYNGNKILTDKTASVESIKDVHGGGQIVKTVYVIAKGIGDLLVTELKSIVLAPFTNITTAGGNSSGTLIGHNVRIEGGSELHSGVLDTELEKSKDSAVKEIYSTTTIENAFETVVEKAKATTNSSTPKASYKKTSYEAASVSAKRNDKKLSTEAWKRKDTEINKVKVSKLFGEKTTYLYGTKTPETPPVTPPPVTPPPTTPPVTPPPTTPPTTPPPTTPPVTPPSITPPTPVTPDTPTEGVLGERREVSPDAAVLGARRRVLGARRGVLGEKRVLGARTEDTSNAAGAVGVMLGSVALSGVWMTLRRKKKIQ